MARALLLLSGLALSCGGSGPTTASPACRNYPSGFTDRSGALFVCELSNESRFEQATTLSCSSGLNYWKWSYAALDDLILEASSPGLRLSTEVVGYQYGFHGGGWNTRSYAFDSQRRVVERARGSISNNVSVSGGVFEWVRFTAWDDMGRPTRGAITSSLGESGVAMSYSSGGRIARWSNGDGVVIDHNANLIEETVGRTASFDGLTQSFDIVGTKRLCRP